MDWYLGCAVDDLVVPSNQTMVDIFPSPNGWCQWELLSSEAFEPVNKYFATQANYTGAGLNFNVKKQNKVGMDLFEHQHDRQSININSFQEFMKGSIDQDASPYQLDDLDISAQNDEVFLNSSHDIVVDTSTGPFNFHQPEFENDDYDVLSSDILSENMIVESKCDQSHLFGRGSSKYLKTHAFSPSVGGGASLHIPQFPELLDNPPSPVKAQYEEVSVSPELEIMDEHISEETTFEAFVLQELENAMTRMSDHRRICFRDALYHLAESSRQHSMDLVLERSSPLMVSDRNFRSEITKNMKAATNAIDRAVANLMFYRMDGDVQNLPLCHSSSSGDAGVLIFS